MMNRIIKLALILMIGLTSGQVSAQCDNVSDRCIKHLEADFISDGQNYRALLVDDEEAEFTTTFYSGVTYRIAACSGDSDGLLEFKVLDQNGRELFNSNDYGNTPYWNFVAESNMDCVIQAKLNSDKVESGCAVILLGFKN